MRIEDASWLGPSDRLLARRRSALGKLEKEKELLPGIIDALRAGRRAKAREAAGALPKKTSRIVEAGFISAVESRLDRGAPAFAPLQGNFGTEGRRSGETILASPTPIP